MEGFGKYLDAQLRMHPSMQVRDVIKMCYQAAFGAEHLIKDPEYALSCLRSEYDACIASGDALYEMISDDVCRVNLSAWKSENLPVEWLFHMFLASCTPSNNAGELFEEYLKAASRFVDSGAAGFSASEWDAQLSEYRKIGMPPVHHSSEYRMNEHPSYRIVNARFLRILPILEKAKSLIEGDRVCVIAIDGRAASGKTTLVEHLRCVLGADVIHLDDFFVPPELRLKERFSKPGENIHHERFREEVLPFISISEPFEYRVFDCSTMDYSGVREIGASGIRIAEGSYSCHPLFGSYADITVFSDVSSDEQRERIQRRNGKEMLERFLTRWIPMEEEYFEYYGIRDKADIIV